MKFTAAVSSFALLAASMLPAVHADDGEQPVMVSIKRMSMETALRVAQATIKACRAEGVQIAVTVLDRSGDVQAQLRDVLAPRLTLSVSRNKAYSAVAFNTPSSALTAQAQGPLGWRDDMGMHPGGLPIQAGGELVGAVGVSGAPSGETDERCAAAGVEAVAMDLDMAD